MGSFVYDRRGIELSHIRIQDQHQQSPAFRFYVDTPSKVVVRFIPGKAGVDVFAGVIGWIIGWKSHRKSSYVPARNPFLYAYQLIEKVVQSIGINRVNKRLLGIHTQTNDGRRPGRRI